MHVTIWCCSVLLTSCFWLCSWSHDWSVGRKTKETHEIDSKLDDQQDHADSILRGSLLVRKSSFLTHSRDETELRLLVFFFSITFSACGSTFFAQYPSFLWATELLWLRSLEHIYPLTRAFDGLKKKLQTTFF